MHFPTPGQLAQRAETDLALSPLYRREGATPKCQVRLATRGAQFQGLCVRTWLFTLKAFHWLAKDAE